MARRPRLARSRSLFSLARGTARFGRSSLARGTARFDRLDWGRRYGRLAGPALRVLLLALCALIALNMAVRASGGAVHALSLGRVGTRALALGWLALHSLHCADAAPRAERSVREAALRHGVPVRLALAVARVESSLVHTRISSTGAMGIMQLMPATARELGVTDPFDSQQGADGGVRYLAQLLSLYAGDTRRAVAAYNAGMGRVPLHGDLHLPPETRLYVQRVLSAL